MARHPSPESQVSLPSGMPRSKGVLEVQIQVHAAVRPTKSGIEARAHRIGLAAHGRSEQEALDSLRSAIRAWCRSLQRAKRSDDALATHGIRAVADGDGIDVNLLVDSR